MGRAFECRLCKNQELITWFGHRCPNPLCGRYANIREVYSDDPNAERAPTVDGQLSSLCDVIAPDIPRISTMITSVDTILGSNRKDGSCGFADGQITMIFGNPGSGKSTLLLQICQGIGKQRIPIIYFVGEERAEQVKERADRLPGKFRSCVRIVRETSLDAILDILNEEKPRLFLVDSVQTIEVEDFVAGSTAAIGVAGREIMKFCKDENIAAFLVAQITKDGGYSGPKTLEHFVDTSLFMKNQGDKRPRILSCPLKNRFGQAGLEAYFMMTGEGLIPCAAPASEEDDGTDVVSGVIHAPPARKKLVVPVEDEEDETATAAEVVTPVPSKPKKKIEKRAPPITEAVAKFENAAPTPPTVITNDPISAWSAPDGTRANTVLEISCDEPDCRGNKGRACTSKSGAREVGFHSSRIEKARLHAKGASGTAPRGKEVIEPVEDAAPPSGPKWKSDEATETLKAPPRLREKLVKPSAAAEKASAEKPGWAKPLPPEQRKLAEMIKPGRPLGTTRLSPKPPGTPKTPPTRRVGGAV